MGMESSLLAVTDHIKSMTGQAVISNPTDHTHTDNRKVTPQETIPLQCYTLDHNEEFGQ